MSSSSSTSSSSSEVSHPNVSDLVQYRLQRFLHDPTISTVPVTESHVALEQAVVQDAQRRMAAHIQAFDIAFNNAAASGSSDAPTTVDDPSNLEAPSDYDTSHADEKSAGDEESETG